MDTAAELALSALLLVLVVFFVFMWARLVFDWVRVLQPGWRPRGVGLVIAEASYAVTDPAIKVVRRAVPPVKVGAAQLEFSWSIVMLACLVLIWVVGLVR
ncbi:MAG: YggT family protein [Actinomycetota bacterium]|nr:YggT family protein [Actinomycetota bacterium]